MPTLLLFAAAMIVTPIKASTEPTGLHPVALHLTSRQPATVAQERSPPLGKMRRAPHLDHCVNRYGADAPIIAAKMGEGECCERPAICCGDRSFTSPRLTAPC